MPECRGLALILALTLAMWGAACSRFSFFLANAPTAFGSYRRLPDLAYGDGPRRRLDLYVPSGAFDLPVVIFWYGGSWTSGRKSDYRFVAAALADRGFVVAIPDYRLHPEVEFPDSAFLRRIFKQPYADADWQPIRFVDSGDPPALLIHGGADRTVDVRHTVALRSALESAGVRVETQIYPSAGHVDLVAAFAGIASGRAPVLVDSVRFIRSVTSLPQSISPGPDAGAVD